MDNQSEQGRRALDYKHYLKRKRRREKADREWLKNLEANLGKHISECYYCFKGFCYEYLEFMEAIKEQRKDMGLDKPQNEKIV